MEATLYSHDILDDLGNLLLCSLPIVNEREDGSSDLILLLGRSRDVLDEVVGLEGSCKRFSRLLKDSSCSSRLSPGCDRDDGRAEVFTVNRIDCGGLLPST